MLRAKRLHRMCFIGRIPASLVSARYKTQIFSAVLIIMMFDFIDKDAHGGGERQEGVKKEVDEYD